MARWTNSEKGRFRREMAKRKAIQALGGRCVCCGHCYPPHLEFHHANDGGRLDRKTLGISQARLISMISAGNYRGKIELLCRNCHHCFSMNGGCQCKEQSTSES